MTEVLPQSVTLNSLAAVEFTQRRKNVASRSPDGLRGYSLNHGLAEFP